MTTFAFIGSTARARLALAVLVCATALPALAEPTLTLPQGAEKTARRMTPNDSFSMPLGPWADGRLPKLVISGAIEEQSWRIPSSPETFSLFERLAKDLSRQGYLSIFSCETDACGGFDFRYELKVLPEPSMHVDLGDFRYLAATKGRGKDADYVTLLVSRAGQTGFVQFTHVGAANEVAGAGGSLDQASPTLLKPTEPPPAVASDPRPVESGPLAVQLENSGRVVLEDLSFASGSAELSSGDFQSLGALAAYLADHPDRQIIIVGHTDASGTLAPNIALSKKRAQSVVDRLLSDFGVARTQVTADGVGFLSPRTTNLTEEGRQKNRRVEAVLASTR
jgi:OOP family OmpA-OmpF porin